MRDALLILWLATMGADRIDLLAGSGPFVLTPFLVLTPIILAMSAADWAIGRRRITIPRDTAPFLLAATGLASVVLVSVLFSSDLEMSAKRTALLFAQLYGSFVIALLLINHARPESILVRGAYWGIGIAIAFNIAQVWFWVTEGATSAVWGVIDLTPQVYGTWVPRLSGAVIDQNRGGLLLLVYLFLLGRFARPSRLRSVFIFVGVLAVITTLSRSAMLGGLATLGVFWITGGLTRFSRLQLFGFACAAAAVAVLLIAMPHQLDVVAAYTEPLAGRFSVAEGSSRVHLGLIERGFEVSTASIQNALIGIGFGNSFVVLEEFFPGTMYANFHSLYLTLLAESGVFALALGLILLLYPVARPGPFLAIIVGMAFFNLFYQSTTDPAFWLMIALAWLTAGKSGHARESRHPASLRETTLDGAALRAPDHTHVRGNDEFIILNRLKSCEV
ncbi:MAG TPA: hypothetical protein VFI91_04345 [Longimicrobiaceae bacterium]|nr:hypothetical protein [Longimicrobiaceae bacterium]